MPFTKGKLSPAEQICNQNYPVKTELSLNNISFATDHNRISCARILGAIHTCKHDIDIGTERLILSRFFCVLTQQYLYRYK